MQKHNHTSSAFTLIELSIVLVIISLIVGGVIGGKSLIHSTRLQSVLTDINGFQTASNTFLLQYDAYAGDFSEGYDYWSNGSNSICGTDATAHYGCNGNGNGIIGDAGGYRDLDEPLRFWKHLQLADIIQDNISYTGEYRNASTISPTTIPTSSYRDNTGYTIINPIMSTTTWDPDVFFGRSGAWIMLSTIEGGSHNNIPIGYTATPADNAALDKKIDDGKPTTGNVITMRSWLDAEGTCTDPSTEGYSMDTTAPSNSIGYAVSNSGNACNPMFYLGGG